MTVSAIQDSQIRVEVFNKYYLFHPLMPSNVISEYKSCLYILFGYLDKVNGSLFPVFFTTKLGAKL